MSLSKQEIEMMDTYFRKNGLGSLQTNVKRLMSDSCGFDKTEIDNQLDKLSESIAKLEGNSVEVDEATINDINNLFKGVL